MKKVINYIALILILFSLTGCPGVLDSLIREELGNGYTFYEEGGFPLICRDLPVRRCIPAEVIDYDFDKGYIIALQNEYKLTTKEAEKYSIEEQRKVINKKGVMKYWIIDKINDSIYGPLIKSEYINKRIELRVPDELKLDFEN